MIEPARPQGSGETYPGNKRPFGGVCLKHAGLCQDNSRGYSAHPKWWMRRYWTVGQKPTKRSRCVDLSAVHQTGD